MRATRTHLRMAVACAVTLVVTGASTATGATTPASPQTSTAAPTPPHPPTGVPGPGPGAKPATKGKAKPAPVKKVDLNNASLAELKTLPMVGDAEAKKIIANRPYKSKGELVTKAQLPEGVYHAVKRKVELKASRKAAATK